MLTLGYSTVGANIINVLNYLLGIRNKNINFLIVCQLYDTSKSDAENLIAYVNEKIVHLKRQLNIDLHFSFEKGLSKSRNTVIENCTTRYVWFLDDDIKLDLEEVESLNDALALTQPNAMLVRIGSLENHGNFYKDYSNFKPGNVKNPLLYLRVSSIELIVDVNFLKMNRILFNESLGLGTPYPCCEENLLLLEMREKEAVIVATTFKPVFHTTKLEQRLPIGEGHFLARGYVAARYPLYLRIPLLIRWAARPHDKLRWVERLRFLIAGAKLNV